MRMLLKWEMGNATATEAIRSGKIAELNKLVDELTNPEAAYFGTENGVRTTYTFFDMADTSQIPVIAEVLFQELDARVEFIPVMNLDELRRGWSGSAQVLSRSS